MNNSKLKCELYNDSFQNFKKYGIQKAQLVIADIPYNCGFDFYASNPVWYEKGDNSNGESKLAKKPAFHSDFSFNVYEYFNFCNRLVKKEPKKGGARGRSSDAPCMIVFCSFQQQHTLIQAAAKHGFIHYIPLTFIKKSSPQALKANMRVVGATERALLFYRGYLPKFRNGAEYDENGRAIRGTGHMVLDWFPFERDGKDIPKIHPAQKPVKVLKKLIETFTDPGDVVIDPCFGSGSTARACLETGRNFYGFEINKEFYNKAVNEMCKLPDEHQVSIEEFLRKEQVTINE
jgi:site-specific DNA-methyltransferase (adenine-specific)